MAALEHVHPRLKEQARAQKRIDIMNEFFPDASVSGWGSLEQSIDLPDPNDAHVVAAAIAGRADVIITLNLKDFPPDTLRPLGLEAQTPDEFLLNQLDLDPDEVMQCLFRQAQATRNPHIAVQELLKRLANSGNNRFSVEAGKQLWRLT